MDEDLLAQGPEENRERLKAIQSLLTSVHKALQTVRDTEDALLGETPRRVPDPPVINLEEARAEIERRLARLAA
ncbi:MAG: hypothetical protein AAF317_00540 [Pseudomonadota bacterium]